MRCVAPVTDERALAWRSSRDPERRCQREGRRLIAGKWFCYQHAPAWETHYAIVERIRNISAGSDILMGVKTLSAVQHLTPDPKGLGR